MSLHALGDRFDHPYRFHARGQSQDQAYHEKARESMHLVADNENQEQRQR